MIIGIVGSRGFGSRKNDKAVENYVDAFVSGLYNYHVLFDVKSVTVLSGGARGVDRFVERACLVRRMSFVKALPKLLKYGSPRAFHVRNDFIIKMSDRIVAFWNGANIRRSGTCSVIRKALKQKKEVLILVYVKETDTFHKVPHKAFRKIDRMLRKQEKRRNRKCR